MPENNEQSSRATTSYSLEFKEFFIKQLELFQARLQQLEQNVRIGWDAEWNSGFNQISQQIGELDRKLAAAIISQRQFITELREWRGAEPPKFDCFGQE